MAGDGGPDSRYRQRESLAVLNVHGRSWRKAGQRAFDGVMRWHLLTPEYPPQVGGVGDFTRALSSSLVADGDEVDVWCPGQAGAIREGRVSVHRQCGSFSPSDLRRLTTLLGVETLADRWLVQWVPHGYGFRTMNLAFCLWLAGHAQRGHRIDLVVHEPFLSFGEGSWRQDAAAVVHRLMIAALLRAADRVFVSTTSWIPKIRPFSFGKHREFTRLPIAATVEVSENLRLWGLYANAIWAVAGL
jgi:hypothetical protein